MNPARNVIVKMEEEIPIKFRVVGVVMTPEFQKCRAYVRSLHKSFPKRYPQPDIRPMMNVEWAEYLTKVKRKIGKGLWALTKPVAVFLNGEFLGDDDDLIKYASKSYRLSIVKNFHKLGREHLMDVILEISDKGRSFVYFTIAVNDREIGSLLFQLYTDLVPTTCSHFLKRCKKKHNGYTGTSIHRIVKSSWIQCGGWELEHHRQPCENYIVPHDRRGILSMCHNGKHNDNSTQFHISLEPTHWMDYYYVAFGQLLQGEPVLRYLEHIPTYYEAPLKKIQIVKSGEFTLCPEPDAKALQQLRDFLDSVDLLTGLPEDYDDPRDTDSVLNRRRYGKGLYCFDTDMQSYLPFLHLPDYLLDYFYGEILLKRPEAVQQEEHQDDQMITDYQSLFDMGLHWGPTPTLVSNFPVKRTISATSSDVRMVRGILKDTLDAVLGDDGEHENFHE